MHRGKHDDFNGPADLCVLAFYLRSSTQNENDIALFLAQISASDMYIYTYTVLPEDFVG